MAALAAVVVGLATGGRAASTPQFTIVDLGTLGTDSYGRALSDGGQVVGYSYTANALAAFSWTESGGMIDLGTLGGNYTAAVAVNNSGQAVGEGLGPSGLRAFSWTQAGGIVSLGTLPGGGQSRARALNGNGVVVGEAYVAGYSRAFIWRSGAGMTPVGQPGPTESSVAVAVNDGGQVVGWHAVGGAASVGFSWTASGGMVDLPGTPRAVNNDGTVAGSWFTGEGNSAFIWNAASGMRDLGSLGCGYAEAVSVSDSGYVAGNTRTSTCDVHAFAWTNEGGMVDLGTLGGTASQATDVNEQGQVVGFSSTPTGETHAFSWTQSGGMVDLGTLGGNSSTAWDVNDGGQIAGDSTTGGGATHAVLWKLADTTAPTLQVPTGVAANATSPGGAVVEFAATATDESPANPEVTCAPPSGSVFPIGGTTVDCEASDAAGNTGTASFEVTVKGAAAQLAELHAAVTKVGPGTSLADKIGAARAALDAGDTPRTCEILDAFINQVRAQPVKILSADTATALIGDATRISAVVGC